MHGTSFIVEWMNEREIFTDLRSQSDELIPNKREYLNELRYLVKHCSYFFLDIYLETS